MADRTRAGSPRASGRGRGGKETENAKGRGRGAGNDSRGPGGPSLVPSKEPSRAPDTVAPNSSVHEPEKAVVAVSEAPPVRHCTSSMRFVDLYLTTSCCRFALPPNLQLLRVRKRSPMRWPLKLHGLKLKPELNCMKSLLFRALHVFIFLHASVQTVSSILPR